MSSRVRRPPWVRALRWPKSMQGSSRSSMRQMRQTSGPSPSTLTFPMVSTQMRMWSSPALSSARRASRRFSRVWAMASSRSMPDRPPQWTTMRSPPSQSQTRAEWTIYSTFFPMRSGLSPERLMK